MINSLLVFLPSLFFLLIKLAFLGVRFSDTNVYFYTAIELLRGKILYKDIFFTNLPLFPYISSIYALLIGKKLEIYYLTAAVEVITTGILIFFLVIKKTNNRAYALASQCLYLFSFIIFSTSDHQTGVFLASLFSVLAYFFYKEDKNFFTGIFLACMILTKAYYLPIVIAFFLYFLIKERPRFLKLFAGFIFTCFFVLFPFIFIAGKNMIQDIIFYSLFRAQGIDKIPILSFFITHDFVFVLLLSSIILRPKKQLLFFYIICFSVLLLIVYKDVYYLYLNLMIPFIVLSFPDLMKELGEKFNKYIPLLYSFIIFLLAMNFFIYLKQYGALQKLDNISEMITVITKEKPQYIYGAMEVAPALSYLSGVPLLDNIIDTNDNLFYKGILNTKKLTSEALTKKTIIVTKGINYPSENLYQPVTGGTVDEEKIIKQCNKIYTQPIITEGLINILTLFRCY